MSSLKPIKLYSHAMGPNPWKVVIVMEELGIPYETEYVDMSVMKQEPFVSVNPNGRVPAIEDPNTGLTLWESGAIVEYLLCSYDKDAKLHYSESPQKFQQTCWAHFQMSGQGPYFGQKAWFSNFHHEKLPSAVERYEKEINRVLGVIDAHLAKTGQPYLVGDKATYADLMFIPWDQMLVEFVIGQQFDAEWKSKYPKAYEWHQKLMARPAVKKSWEARAAAIQASKH